MLNLLKIFSFPLNAEILYFMAKKKKKKKNRKCARKYSLICQGTLRYQCSRCRDRLLYSMGFVLITE